MKQQNLYPFSSISLKLTADAIEWLSGTTTDNDDNEIRNFDIFSRLLKEMRTSAGYDGTYRRPFYRGSKPPVPADHEEQAQLYQRRFSAQDALSGLPAHRETLEIQVPKLGPGPLSAPNHVC